MNVVVRYRKDRGYFEAYYSDPATGKRVVKSLNTADWKTAQRAAADWIRDVEQGVLPKRVGWAAFRERFEDEHPAAPSYAACLNHFERLHGEPTDLNTIDGSAMSKFARALRDDGLGEERVGGVLRGMRVVFRFAVRVGLMRTCPPISMPKVVKRKLWRSRAITEDEFHAMLKAVPRVVGKSHAPGWERLLRGLWLFGLRINEALRLSWDSPPLRVVMGKRPTLVIFGEGQKSREDEVLPITPDFAALLEQTPERDRRGKVFPLTHARWKITRENACRVIGAIGEAAGVVVADEKFATAHDLRRAFGQRWSTRVKPLILQRLMRHKSLTTTMRYYVETGDDDVTAAVWLPEWLPTSDEKRKAPTKNRRKST